MSIIENKRLIIYTKYFLKLLWLVNWFIIIAVLVYEIAIPNHAPRHGIPIRFSLSETGVLPLSTESVPVRITRAVGELSILIPLSFGLRLFHTLALMSGFFLVIGILYQIRKIFDTLVVGTPFIRENGVRLRWISLFVFLIGMHKGLILILYYLLFTAQVQLAGIQPYMLEPRLTMGFPWSYTTVTLLILVLAEFFRMGAEMAEEQELTV